MIGTLINNFDNLEEPTLEAFNDTFNMTVTGDLNAPVRIGVMVVGGLREVIIGGKIELIELKRLPDVAKKPEDVFITYEVSFEGQHVCYCSTFTKVADMLQTNVCTIRRYEKENWLYFGYQVKKERVSHEKFLDVAKLPTPKTIELDKSKKRISPDSGRPSLYRYIVTVANNKTEFNSLKEVRSFLEVSRKMLESRIRKYPNGKKIGGWSIKKELKEI